MKDLNSHLPDPAARSTRTGLDGAMQFLASSITATPREAESAERAPRRHTRRAFTLVAATAACAVAALIGVNQLVGGNGTGSAWAAADIAVAQQTPLVLLESPGWKITKFDQYKAKNTTGGIMFNNGATGPGAGAMIFWEPVGHLKHLRRQLSSRATQLPAMPVAGHQAEVYRQHSEGSVPMYTGHTALWVSGKYAITFGNEYRGKPSKLEDQRFAKLLAQVKAVSPDQLLASLPSNYLLPSRLPGAAARILADVPQPPGFSSTPLLVNLQGSGQHALAERLINNVQCGWIHDWVAAREQGNKAEMTRISNVLAPYKTWKYAERLLPPGSKFKKKVYVGEGYIEALKHGGRMHFGPGDTRDIGKIYKSWLGCELL